VSMKYRNRVGEGVAVGVFVGVGVMLGVFDAVGEGPVAVGNGASSAFDVRAMAVRVLLALEKRSSAEADGRMNPSA
jgi:hypothetical protein